MVESDRDRDDTTTDHDQDRIRDRVDEWLSGFMHKLRVGKEWGQDERRMHVPTLTSEGNLTLETGAQFNGKNLA